MLSSDITHSISTVVTAFIVVILALVLFDPKKKCLECGVEVSKLSICIGCGKRMK